LTLFSGPLLVISNICYTSSILDGQAKSVCSFCGNIGHVENTCRAKEREMKDAKQFTKDKAQKWKKDKLEKAQSFETATAKAASFSASKKIILMRTNLISMIP
jgi:hypothetical protein